MLLQAEAIHRKATDVVKYCGTRNTLRLARDLGIFVHLNNDFEKLLGMYTYINRERHILLNGNMDDMLTQMVCGHEIGHDLLHRDIAKKSQALQEFVLFDIRNSMEYEANAFAAHLRIDDDDLLQLMEQGCDVVQMASIMGTNVNLMLIKLNELNRMGWRLDLPYIPRSNFLRDVSLDD